MTKRLCQDKTSKNLNAFLACRLMPLDKQLGLRPLGIGKILRSIIAKVVMKLPRRMPQDHFNFVQGGTLEVK